MVNQPQHGWMNKVVEDAEVLCCMWNNLKKEMVNQHQHSWIYKEVEYAEVLCCIWGNLKREMVKSPSPHQYAVLLNKYEKNYKSTILKNN